MKEKMELEMKFGARDIRVRRVRRGEDLRVYLGSQVVLVLDPQKAAKLAKVLLEAPGVKLGGRR